MAVFLCYSVWQHVECMQVDPKNLPENYLCELCEPRSALHFGDVAVRITFSVCPLGLWTNVVLRKSS